MISTVNICIREYNECDIQAHCNAVISSLTELNKWFSWAKPDYCLCDSYEFITNQNQRKKGDKYDYAIIDSDSGEFLGSCGLNIIDTYKQTVTMSYWIKSDKCGRHIMTKAANQLKDKGFKEHGFSEIEIRVAYCNPASKHVAENIGATPVDEDFEVIDGHGEKHKGIRYTVRCESKSDPK